MRTHSTGRRIPPPALSLLLLLPMLGSGASAARAQTARTFGPDPGEAAPVRGVATWSSPGAIRSAAAARNAVGERDPRAAQRLESLLRIPGQDLYLEIDRAGPFRVTLHPVRGSRLRLGAGDAERSPVSLSSETAGTAPAGAEPVHVFRVEGGTQREYRVEVPSSVVRVTLVVRGHEVLSAYPLETAAGPATIDVPPMAADAPLRSRSAPPAADRR